MRQLLIILFVTLSSSGIFAQLSSTDIKDASTTGPFPLYFGLGFANSFRNQDLVDVGKVFHAFHNSNRRVRTRLYGLNAMAGFSLIPENSAVSYVVELRYLWLKRPMTAQGNEFFLEKHQTSLGFGVRYALFPFVVQLQAGPILRHFRYYSFEVDGEKTFSQFQSKLNGINSLIRIALLDPAGTEGGIGFYFEAGYNFTGFLENNNELSLAIQSFDPLYSTDLDSNNRYGYLSLGIILPIAIKIR